MNWSRQLNAPQIREAVTRMNSDEVAFLKQVVEAGSPGEAARFVELFHYFPGTRMEVDASPAILELEQDALETQTRFDVWEEQDKHSTRD